MKKTFKTCFKIIPWMEKKSSSLVTRKGFFSLSSARWDLTHQQWLQVTNDRWLLGDLWEMSIGLSPECSEQVSVLQLVLTGNFVHSLSRETKDQMVCRDWAVLSPCHNKDETYWHENLPLCYLNFNVLCISSIFPEQKTFQKILRILYFCKYLDNVYMHIY